MPTGVIFPGLQCGNAHYRHLPGHLTPLLLMPRLEEGDDIMKIAYAAPLCPITRVLMTLNQNRGHVFQNWQGGHDEVTVKPVCHVVAQLI